ncbi:putative glycoside hydrolase [Pseudomonas sp. CGJS7]|uniref:putative glycoside hydrolase n=1 Tax=Pseudomonas sp. CGJS7 TaxID=3109348 RepID=UPI00300AFAB8
MSNRTETHPARWRLWSMALSLAALLPTAASSADHAGQLYLDYAEVPLITRHAGAHQWMVVQSYMRVHVDIAQLKAANPGMRVFMYFETAGAYDLPPSEEPWPSGVSYRWVKANRPEWIVKDRAGRPITFWGGELYLYDVGNKAYQDEWARRAIDYAKTGGFDGVFADDVNMGESFRSTGWSGTSPKYPTDLSWTQATESFLNNVAPKLRAAGIALLPNVASAWNSDRATQVRWAKIAGAYAREHYQSWPNGDAPGEYDPNKGLLGGADWAWMSALHRDIVAARVPFYAFPHAGGWQAIDKMRYTRASYLLWYDPALAGGYAYATGGGPHTGQDPYNAAWNFDLGAPTGPAVQRSSGVWARSFARGTVVVDSNTKTATVTP